MELSEDIEREIIEKIKKLRIEKGISGEMLANMVGISYTHYRRIERRDYSPSLKMLIRILDKIGYKIEILNK